MIGYILLALLFAWVVFTAASKLAADLEDR